jgi:hypothetical protein
VDIERDSLSCVNRTIIKNKRSIIMDKENNWKEEENAERE